MTAMQRSGQQRHQDIELTVRGGDGRDVPISAASVDRIRHTVTHTQYGSPCYEVRMWSDGRRVRLVDGDHDDMRQLATQVAARYGVGRLEIGMDWGTSIFYLLIAVLPMILVTIFGLYMILTQGPAMLVMIPVFALLGFAGYRTMRGRWPPRRAGSLEKFLAILPRR